MNRSEKSHGLSRRTPDLQDRLFGILIAGFGLISLVAFAKIVFVSNRPQDLLTGCAVVSTAFFFYLRWRIFDYLQNQADQEGLNEDWIRWTLRVFSVRSPVSAGLDRLSGEPDSCVDRVGKEE